MRQKEFTRDDYKNLDFVGKKRLREYRDGLAKELNQSRNEINKELESRLTKGSTVLDQMFNTAAKADANKKRAKEQLRISIKGSGYSYDPDWFRRPRAAQKSIYEHQLKARKLRRQKAVGERLKKAGKVAVGTALAAGLVYGGKKLYDKYKNKDMKEQKEFAENLPMETPKVSKERASKLRDMFNRAKENIKNSKAGKNAAEFYAKHEKGVKIGGGVAAGTALAAGLAVGAKKLADKKKEQQKEFARADYEGLNFIETFKKNYKRNRVAQELKKQRNQINKELEENLKYNASRAKKIANLKRAKALDSIRLGETMENLANLAGSPAEAFKKKPMSNLKKAGYAGLGVAGAAGLAYGGKKLYDKYKKNNESDNKD